MSIYDINVNPRGAPLSTLEPLVVHTEKRGVSVAKNPGGARGFDVSRGKVRTDEQFGLCLVRMF